MRSTEKERFSYQKRVTIGHETSDNDIRLKRKKLEIYSPLYVKLENQT